MTESSSNVRIVGKKTWPKPGRIRSFRPMTTPYSKWWLGMEEVVYSGSGDSTTLNMQGEWVKFEKDVPVKVHGLQAQRLLRTGNFRRITPAERLIFSIKTGAEKLLILRGGGMGDILMLTPTLRKLKKLYPDLSIDLMTNASHQCFFEENPSIHKVLVAYTTVDEFDQQDWSSWDVFMNINMYVERSEKYPTTHRIDLFAESLGVSLEPDERDVELHLPKRYEALADQKLKELKVDRKKPLAILQVRGMAQTRTLPLHTNQAIANLMVKKGYQVMLVDHEAKGWQAPGIIDATGKLGDVGVLGAVLKRSAVTIGPDSGVAHLAAALGVKAVICTTTVPAHLRYTYYKNVLVIEPTHLPCYPCGEGSCPALSCTKSHKPEQIVEAALSIIRRKRDFACISVPTQ